MNFKQAFIAFLGVVAIAWVANLGIASKIPYRGFYTGDQASGKAAWIAGQNFDRLGFWKLKLVPIEMHLKEPGEELKPEDFYTHYPPGHEIIQGVLFRLGFSSPVSHHVFSLLAASAGVGLGFLVLAQALSPSAALFGASAMLLSPAFLYFADSLHMYPWFYLFNGLMLWRLWVLWRRGLAQGACRAAMELFLIALVASWFSFDLAPPLLCLSFAPMFWARRREFLRERLLLLVAAPLGEVVGFLLHVLKNGFALGGVGEAFMDILGALFNRLGIVPASNAKLAEVAALALPYDPVRHFAKWFLGVQWFYTWPFLIFAVLGALMQLRRSGERAPWWRGILISFGLAGICWQILMRQHAMIHTFTVRHLEWFVAMGLACLWFAVAQGSAVWRKGIQVALVLGIALHASLALAQWQAIGIKRSVISGLISDPSVRSCWSKSQLDLLSANPEREQVKGLLREWSPESCAASAGAVRGLGAQISSFVLFWY